MKTSNPALDLGQLAPALPLAAAAVARLLPGEAPLAAATETGPAPDPSTRLVIADLAGIDGGVLAVAIDGPLAGDLEHGPLGDQSLVDALRLALDDAARAVAGALALDLRADAAREAGGVFPPADHQVAWVPIVDGDRARAWFGLAIPAAAPGDVAHFEPLAGPTPRTQTSRPLDLLHDVEMAVSVELGRTRMTVRELLALSPGAVVELDRAAGSPVDVFVNATLVARGEVVVVDDEFAVRITEIVSSEHAGR